MKKMFFLILISIAAIYGAIYSYINMQQQPILAIEFICGLVLGVIIMNIWVNIKNNKINIYKRALEKETISSSENSSRIKVLESKIKVLEKALEDALQTH